MEATIFPDLIGQLAGVPNIPELPPGHPFGKPDFRRPAIKGNQISLWGSQDDCLGFRNIFTDAGSYVRNSSTIRMYPEGIGHGHPAMPADSFSPKIVNTRAGAVCQPRVNEATRHVHHPIS